MPAAHQGPTRGGRTTFMPSSRGQRARGFDGRGATRGRAADAHPRPGDAVDARQAGHAARLRLRRAEDARRHRLQPPLHPRSLQRRGHAHRGADRRQRDLGQRGRDRHAGAGERQAADPHQRRIRRQARRDRAQDPRALHELPHRALHAADGKAVRGDAGRGRRHHACHDRALRDLDRHPEPDRGGRGAVQAARDRAADRRRRVLRGLCAGREEAGLRRRGLFGQQGAAGAARPRLGGRQEDRAGGDQG